AKRRGRTCILTSVSYGSYEYSYFYCDGRLSSKRNSGAVRFEASPRRPRSWSRAKKCDRLERGEEDHEDARPVALRRAGVPRPLCPDGAPAECSFHHGRRSEHGARLLRSSHREVAQHRPARRPGRALRSRLLPVPSLQSVACLVSDRNAS